MKLLVEKMLCFISGHTTFESTKGYYACMYCRKVKAKKFGKKFITSVKK